MGKGKKKVKNLPGLKYLYERRNITIMNGYQAFMALNVSNIGKTDEDIDTAKDPRIKIIMFNSENIFFVSKLNSINIPEEIMPIIKIYLQMNKFSVAETTENKLGSRKNKSKWSTAM